MKLISKNLFYFFGFIILFSITGCGSSETQTVTEETEAFTIEPYYWNSISEDIQLQIGGAGCEFHPMNDDTQVYMLNGYVKINGIFELLEEKQTNSADYSKQVYENNRWIITIEMYPNKTNDYKEPGSLTLRSKVKDGSTSIDVIRICGT